MANNLRIAALMLSGALTGAAQEIAAQTIGDHAAWTAPAPAPPADAPAPAAAADPAPRETHRARFRRRTKAVATVAAGVALVVAYVFLRAYAAP